MLYCFVNNVLAASMIAVMTAEISVIYSGHSSVKKRSLIDIIVGTDKLMSTHG